MNNVIVGVDGSEHSMRAVAVAVDMAAKAAGELILVNASELPLMLDGELENYARVEHVKLEQIRGLLADPQPACLEIAEAQARKLGAKTVRPVAVVGDAAEEIVAAANRHGSAAIVVGRRGKGRLADLVFGSVSQKIVRLSSCPVVIVP